MSPWGTSFLEVCKTGSYEDVLSMVEVAGHLNSTEYKHGFFGACESGQLQTAKCLYLKKHLLLRESLTDAFQYACRGGQLEIAEWLIYAAASTGATVSTTMDVSRNGRSRCMPLNVSANHDYAFRSACGNGHMHVVQWLMKHFHSKINMCAENNEAFELACENGHLDIAKLLYQHHPEDIQTCITRTDAYMFREACKNGHASVVQWLLATFPSLIDVSFANHYALRKAAENAHDEVMHLLLGLTDTNDTTDNCNDNNN